MSIGITWRHLLVDGRDTSYGVAGSGPTVVFLHGWGLSHRTYRHGLERLVGRGVRVVAPALPGFGGTAALPAAAFSLEGYAAWVAAFLRELGTEEPVTLAGHSFGGGVALRTAHDHPELVGQLVLINSIGGSVWARRGELPVLMSDRPVWDWGLHLAAHAISVRSFTRVMPVIAADAVPNFLLHPGTLWRVGRLARDANLSEELEELKGRGLPIVIVWGRDDTVIPWACAESLVIALGGPEVVTVPGNHSWLLADPNRFAEVITNVLGVAEDEETQAS
ncbi:alpha/beta fold hydrolase [Nocardioides panaciterrulae]|uniref:Pimeloyl-ACP methyl ester carboxylesterase n=1 Tax=Nocardioides panaciterrulae TaxID=661492 RepID=A0A7Y9E345_9ACTN|nr:alpha/beta fold hydrolase [Nocardioides panaciterrulae]NYD40170.1 pimeloyl-ACP methyl ester carboxylesterase [Nocardioides panaciterrulae]